MLEILKGQPDLFFPNLALFEKARGLNLVSLPSEYLKIAKKNNVSKFMFNIMGNADKRIQTLEYQKAFKTA
jgi:hypothetical protein